MIEFTLKLADVPVRVVCQYPSTKEYCRRFLTGEPPAFSVTVGDEDCRFEQSVLNEGAYSPQFYERLAVYRKICEELAEYAV